MMLADIASGDTDFADVLFLLALIVFIVGAVGSVVTTPFAKLSALLSFIGLALVAFGLLVL